MRTEEAATMTDVYHSDLDKNPANYSSLSPVDFLLRSATVFPGKTAVIDQQSYSYLQLYNRVVRMASSLSNMGVGRNDTVSVLCFNTLELLETHYSVPMLGAVLNTLNTRQDAASLRYILAHCESSVLIYDTEFELLVGQIIDELDKPPALIAIVRDGGPAVIQGHQRYEDLVSAGDDSFVWHKVQDEWDPISLNYTSGTTGNPKGVVYHHRGAWLSTMSNAMALNMTADSVYLWTLPMFHCNGWCYTWAVTAVGGTHVCLRKIDPEQIHQKIVDHKVTHMCGAPVVLNMILNDFSNRGWTIPLPTRFALGGAAPSATVVRKGQDVGFDICHLYGLTESYGPSAVCVWQNDWETLDADALAEKMSRQGTGLYAIDALVVLDRTSGEPVPADGTTLGELALRGNTVMKGYLKNPAGTREAFADGWFRTGDLAVMHPDNYVEIKDRAKDIIISGGENISSKEIEDVLYRHPDVFEVAVVALAHEKWGEVPCAFITLKNDDTERDPAEFIRYCSQHLASFKVPKKIVLGQLPKTATGKIRKNILRDLARETGNDRLRPGAMPQ